MLEAGRCDAPGGSHPATLDDRGSRLRSAIVGLARAPDNVAFPLAAPRVYISRAALERQAPAPRSTRTSTWPSSGCATPPSSTRCWSRRAITSYGIHDLSFVTRSGVRVLIDQAAGIVIALLAALSLVALLTAAVMLAASARAEVQRRLRAIGICARVGATPGYVAGVCAAEAVIVARPGGRARAWRPDLLARRPERPPARRCSTRPAPAAPWSLPLAGCFALAVAIPVALAAWPAWRAASAPPVALLRGAELRRGRARRPRPARRGGPGWCGSVRGSRSPAACACLATLVSLAACAAFVLLMLALAAQLSALENDPAALGRRYQLLASLPAAAAARVARAARRRAVAPRYELTAARLVLARRDDRRDRLPRRPDDLRGSAAARWRRRSAVPGEAEVGLGLAQVLGLGVGSTLALALPSGRELRLRVAAVVSSLQHDGRIAYVPAAALLAADPAAPEQLAIRLAPGASAGAAAAALAARGDQHQRDGEPRRRQLGRSSRPSRRCCGPSRSWTASSASTRSCRRWP